MSKQKWTEEPGPANPIKAAGERLRNLAPWATMAAVSRTERAYRDGTSETVYTVWVGKSVPDADNFHAEDADLAALVARAEGWIAERTLSAEAQEPGPSPT